MTEETVFQEALSRSPEERASFLAQACAGRPELRAAVEALLAAHARPGNVLDRPPQDLAQTCDSDPGALMHGVRGECKPEPEGSPRQTAPATDCRPEVEPGLVIAGRYVLQEKIGEGGMGEVWVAKQTEPVKRKVALKLIKTGMDSKAVLVRFEAERQALALMDHPNIARVLDGGMTPTGQPFFVMELVNGMPLNKFCDESRLTPKERLELFVPICQAVQHAHQKGIVHRDLKPSNILVTLTDSQPVPKVIDFGLAKAMAGRLTEASMSTHFGAVVGTLEYMSPEQAGLSSEDIDTRADIYSLGVILYELLTGLRPIDANLLQKAALAEMIRIIQEEEPSKPSTRLSTDKSLPSLAALRQIEPKKLMALLRGELDWVVMKCLEKRRDRRYETANGLARDIQRYLADEAVEARPPSAGYRLHKFLKRNKGPVIAASLILCALLAGIAGTTWGLIEARRQEQIAHQETAEKEKARQSEAERAEGERLARLDAQARQAEAERQKRRAETGEKLASERLLQVAVEKKKAEEEKQIAQSVRDFLENRLLGQADPRTQADDLLRSGGLSAEVKENPTIRELLDRAAKELAPERIDATVPNQPLVQAEILQTVGRTYQGVGDLERAIGFLKRSTALYRQYLGPQHPDTLQSMNNLAAAHYSAGNLDLALPLFEETLKLRKVTLGPDHPQTFQSMNNLNCAYQAAGKRDLALPLFEETLKLSKAKLGPEHPQTLMIMNGLATAYFNDGKLDLAMPLFEETLKLSKAKLGPDHPTTLYFMTSLARAYHYAGKRDLALPLFEETLKLQRLKLGPDHPETLLTMSGLAVAYQAARKMDLALPLMEEGYRVAKIYSWRRWMGTQLLDGYLREGRTEPAAALAKELLADARAQLPKESPQLAGQLEAIALSLLQAEAFTEAEPLLRECLSIREKTQPGEWTTFSTKSRLGGALSGQEKYAEAEPQLLAGYEGMKQREAKIPPPDKICLTATLERLVQVYEALEKKDEATTWRKELETRKEAQQRLKADQPRPPTSPGRQ